MMNNRFRRVAIGTPLMVGYWVAIHFSPISVRWGTVLSVPYFLLVYLVLATTWPLGRGERPDLRLAVTWRPRRALDWLCLYFLLANALFLVAWGLFTLDEIVSTSSAVPPGVAFVLVLVSVVTTLMLALRRGWRNTTG